MVTIMTSMSSGYLTMRENITKPKNSFTCKNLYVPDNNLVMLSFKELSHIYPSMWLKQITCDMEDFIIAKDGLTYVVPLIWSRRRDFISDFVQLRNNTSVSVEVSPPDCVNTTCFRLYFDFFPEDNRPAQLPNGLWNCSVKDYASFHHHLACNLKTECEDGRDETSDCPYSSPECHGLIALCDRCYTVVKSLADFASDETDYNKKANQYCKSLGGQLSLPKCIYDWRDVIQKKTLIHPERLAFLWTGLYTGDRSLQNIYIHAVTEDDRTVLHHSVETLYFDTFISKLCFYTGKLTSVYGSTCGIKRSSSYSANNGVVCEFAENNTKKHIYRSNIRQELIGQELVLPRRQHELAKCPDGHVTYTFLTCGSDQYKICGQHYMPSCFFPGKTSLNSRLHSPSHGVSAVPVFTCNDGITKMSYTQLCDLITDCPDDSDESFCKHPPCVNKFRCMNSQCLSFDKVCDFMFHCQDHSDEQNCENFRKKSKTKQPRFPPPVLVNFDGITHFISTPMNSSEPCPDSHYRCPGDFNDCLPVYTRCNGMYDCIDHQDEEGCEELTCPGFFRCRLSGLCLHSEHICDGWSHCPMNDDELSCDIICPVNCLCQGHTFKCFQSFSASPYPQLRYLDVTDTGMTLYDVSSNVMLVGIVFAQCSITLLHNTQLVNLRYLDLSNNKLHSVNLTSLLGLENLQTLSLSNNPVTSIHIGQSPVSQHSTLTALDLSFTTLAVLETQVLSLFPDIQKLNLTSASVHTITPPGFQFNLEVSELLMDGSPIEQFPSDIFRDLSSLQFISTENYKLCCAEILPHNFDQLKCIAPQDEISSCEDLLQSWTYRGFLGLIACLSLIGNAACGCARLFARSLASSSGFSVFVTNLTIADFLMGAYIAIIGVADEQFRGQYLHNDEMWKNSAICKLAGFLSLLSSEVSALIIWFITLDRFIVLRFPFSTVRFDRRSAAVACLFTWLAGFILAVLPLLPMTSHWQFYSQTGICIPLPVTRREFKGRVYSFSVLIVLNFIVFVFISAGQAFIYWSIQANAMKTDSSKASRDMTIARRLVTIAVTDFMCWFPIGVCGMLALAGTPIPGEVNVALAVFVLPLNSAVNPFMYTFNTLAEKRSKTHETKLLKWLESHSDLVVN